MKERGNYIDFSCSFSDISCKKHPSSSSVGICAYCLNDRLVNLVCSCSDASPYRNSRFMENENFSEYQNTESNDAILLRRSNSSCVEVKRSKNGFWKIRKLFIRKKREKGVAKDGVFDDKSEFKGVSRSRSLCSFRGGGMSDADEGSDYAYQSAKISDDTGGVLFDSGKSYGFSDFEPRKSGFRGLSDAESEPRKSGFRGLSDAGTEPRKSGFRGLSTDAESEPRKSGFWGLWDSKNEPRRSAVFRGLSDAKNEPKKSGFRGLTDSENDLRKSGFRGLSDAKNEPKQSGFRGLTDSENEPRKSGFRGLSDAENEPRRSEFRGLSDAENVPRRSGIMVLTDSENEPRKSGFRGLTDSENEPRRSGFRGLSDAKNEPRKSGFRVLTDSENEPRKSGFRGLSDAGNEPRRSGFRTFPDGESGVNSSFTERGGPGELNRVNSVPNRSVFPVKESDFSAMDDSSFFDLKLDFSSESNREFTRISAALDHGRRLRSEIHASGDLMGNFGSNLLVSSSTGGSCRITAIEKEFKSGSRKNKVWKWIFRQNPGRRSSKKDEK